MKNRLSMSSTQGYYAEDTLRLPDLWKIVQRRRTIIATVLLTVLGVAATYCIFSTRKYQAVGEVNVQRETSDALNLGTLMGSGTEDASDWLDATRVLQTQVGILESQSLALEVVKQLHIENSEDFKPRFDPIGKVMDALSPKGAPDPTDRPFDEMPARREQIYKTFEKNTKVTLVPGTRLIQISYTSTSPAVAANVVNKLIEALVDYNFQARYTATKQASDWLSQQLTDLRMHSDQLQAQLAEKQKDSGVYSFGGEGLQSKGLAYSPVLDQLQQATASLNQAETNRVMRGAMYEAARTGDPGMIAGLNSALVANGAPSAVGNSLSLLQTLRAQEATEQALISQAAAKFGSAYPKLDEMRASSQSLQESIDKEQERLLSQTKSDYDVARQVEGSTRAIFEQQKQAAEALNSKAIEYEILHQEADDSRNMYEKLSSRLKEANVLESMRPSNITVLEPGRIPAKPAKPNVPLVLAGALAGGIFLGVMMAFMIDVMDSKVRQIGVAMGQWGEGLLAELPFERRKVPRGTNRIFDRPSRIFTLVDPRSPFSEALRNLRTAIMLSSGAPPKVILVTSSVPSEGKTTLATNLSALLVQQGKSVLLVDADLRHPSLHSIFELSSQPGLGDLLKSGHPEDAALSTIQEVQDVPGLKVLTAGGAPDNPSELLGSEKMRRLISNWRDRFDFIVLDAEPLLPVTDSVVLTPLVDRILLVARHGVTERHKFERSLQMVEALSPDIPVGIVLNAIKIPSEPRIYNYLHTDNRANKALEGRM
jgi:capsular exopolysaccharide synthesis family protein